MALSRQEIDLVVQMAIEGAREVISDIRKVESATDDTGDAAKGGGLRFTELASALSLAQQGFQVVSSAAKFAYDNIKEGAQLELARAQFDNLAASINTTSDSLLNNLRTATKGMQSDAELIAGATDIINLGLANTQEGTVRLATAVSTLGLDMQQVILTFANNSKARLDALGLSIEDVDAKTAELNAQGFKGDAFDEAVLIALEEKMTLLGDASETTAGQLQILESDWKNLTDSLKQGAAELAGPTVHALVSNQQAVDALKRAAELGALSQEELNKALLRLPPAGTKADDVMEEYAEVLAEADRRAEALALKTEEMGKTLMFSAEAVSGADAVLLQYVDTTEYMIQATEAADAVLLQTVGTYQANADAAALLAEKQANAAANTETLLGNSERASEQLHRMAEAGLAAAAGMSVIIPAADGVGASVDRANIHLEKLLGYMNSLDGRNVSASVTVNTYGAGNLPDFGGGGDTKVGGGAKGGSGGVGTAPATGPAVVNQTNNFNNASNPNAVATAVAEKMGQYK